MSCPINCQTLGTHESQDLLCIGVRPAGAKDIILFKCLDNVSDITNPNQINNAIANDEAILISDVRFGSSEPAPTLGPKTTSCGVEGVLFNTYPFTITDYSYSQINNALYTALAGGYRIEGMLVHDCPKTGFSDTSRFYDASDSGMVITGGLSSPDDDVEAAVFKMNGSFKGSITIIATPAGVF